MFRLDGQLAIVTGGAQGIGAGVCEVFLEAGATVAMWDITDGQALVDRLKTANNHIFYQKVNVADPDSVQSAVDEIIQEHGKIDILINNAGIIRDRSFMKMDRGEWDAVVNVNINSLFVTSKAVLPHMIAAKYGRNCFCFFCQCFTWCFWSNQLFRFQSSHPGLYPGPL